MKYQIILDGPPFMPSDEFHDMVSEMLKTRPEFKLFMARNLEGIREECWKGDVETILEDIL